MIEERCSLQCPLLTLYPSHHFPCLILYSGKFSREKGYIIKQKCLWGIFCEWQSICEICKNFLPWKCSAIRYALCCIFWHAKMQEVPCGPQDLWDYTFADWEVLHLLLSMSTGSIIWCAYIIAYALYICVKRIYRVTLAKQWCSSCHSVWHMHVSLTVFLCLHCMQMQIHSERDRSHGEDGEEHDGTAHQDVPVAGPIKGAVPSQSLEVTVSNMRMFPCILIVCCIAEEGACT